jgi:hypothetical protein
MLFLLTITIKDIAANESMTFHIDYGVNIRNEIFNRNQLLIVSARNEYESILLIINLPDAKDDLFNVNVSDFLSESRGGKEQVSLCNTLYSVRNIKTNVAIKSEYLYKKSINNPDLELEEKLFPDKLIPEENNIVKLKKGRNLLWLTCYVPKEVQPGNYYGKVTVSNSSSKVSISRAIKYKIKSFIIPKIPSIPYLIGTPRFDSPFPYTCGGSLK